MEDKKIKISRDLKEAWNDFLNIVSSFSVDLEDELQAQAFSTALANVEKELTKSGCDGEKKIHAAFRTLAYESNLGKEYQHNPDNYDALFDYLKSHFDERISGIALDAIKTSFERKMLEDETHDEIYARFTMLGDHSYREDFRELIVRYVSDLMHDHDLREKVMALHGNNINFWIALDRSVLVHNDTRRDVLLKFPALAAYKRYLEAAVNDVMASDPSVSPRKLLAMPEVQAELQKPENAYMVKRLHDFGLRPLLGFMDNLEQQLARAEMLEQKFLEQSSVEKLDLPQSGSLDVALQQKLKLDFSRLSPQKKEPVVVVKLDDVLQKKWSDFIHAITSQHNEKVLKAFADLVRYTSEKRLKIDDVIPFAKQMNLTDGDYERVLDVFMERIQTVPSLVVNANKYLALANSPEIFDYMYNGAPDDVMEHWDAERIMQFLHINPDFSDDLLNHTLIQERFDDNPEAKAELLEMFPTVAQYFEPDIEEQLQSYHAERVAEREARAVLWEVFPEYIAELEKINVPSFAAELKEKLEEIASGKDNKLPSLETVREWVARLNRASFIAADDAVTTFFQISPHRLKEVQQELAWRNVVKACEAAAKISSGRQLNVKHDVVRAIKPQLDDFMRAMGDGVKQAKIVELAEKSGVHFDANANQNVKLIFNDMSLGDSRLRKQAQCLQSVFNAMEDRAQKNIHGMSPRK